MRPADPERRQRLGGGLRRGPRPRIRARPHRLYVAEVLALRRPDLSRKSALLRRHLSRAAGGARRAPALCDRDGRHRGPRRHARAHARRRLAPAARARLRDPSPAAGAFPRRTDFGRRTAGTPAVLESHPPVCGGRGRCARIHALHGRGRILQSHRSHRRGAARNGRQPGRVAGKGTRRHALRAGRRFAGRSRADTARDARRARRGDLRRQAARACLRHARRTGCGPRRRPAGAAGIAASAPRAIRPSLEDVFVRLVERPAQQEAS